MATRDSILHGYTIESQALCFDPGGKLLSSIIVNFENSHYSDTFLLTMRLLEDVTIE
jgi:hypothetical protein